MLRLVPGERETKREGLDTKVFPLTPRSMEGAPIELISYQARSVLVDLVRGGGGFIQKEGAPKPLCSGAFSR